MKKIFSIAALVWMMAGGAMMTPAQEAVPPPAPVYQPLSGPQLDQLLGPIALYPDPLIAEILPASTFPTEIVMADRYVSGGGDPGAVGQQPWDTSIQALTQYPQVLQWMDQNLDWTTELGQAFLNQPQDVMDSIQRLRADAENYGNLESTPQEQVETDDGDIEILPADPDTIYVPVYNPEEVYDQSGFGLTFGVGFPIGIWLDHDFDWHNHRLVQWGRDHPRPADWWHERPDQRQAAIAHDTTVWHSQNHDNVGASFQGDRGWDNRGAAPAASRPQERPQSRTVTVIGSSANQPRPAAEPRAAAPRTAAIPSHTGAPPAGHYQPISHPTSDGAYIGIQSSQETRSYSDRGRQSMDTVEHSAPVERSEPASRPSPPSGGGGGGGGHGGGAPPKR
jgi:hypothetical protein